MYFTPHVLTGTAVSIPVPDAVPVLSLSPVIIPASSVVYPSISSSDDGNTTTTTRPVDLQIRVVLPVAGRSPSSSGKGGGPLPVVILAHGHGPSNHLSSLEGYAPLAEWWASRGFAVLQPTFLSSRTVMSGLPSPPAGQELWWESRARDVVALLDNLHIVEGAVRDAALLPGMGMGDDTPLLDRSRIALAGHSFSGLTTSMLLGMSNVDPRSGRTVRVYDGRIRCGVVLGGLGAGGAENLSENGRTNMVPFYGPDFSAMTTPALVVYGDEDVSPHLTTRGADWHGDAYALSPGPKDLFVVKGGHHGLGGISGWDAAETRDESPERLEAVRRITWAYLWSQLHQGEEKGGESWWELAKTALSGLPNLGSLEAKN